MDYRMLVLGAVLAGAAPAQAQQVELLTFGGAPGGLVLEVGPVAPTAPEAVPGELPQRLAADFEAYEAGILPTSADALAAENGLPALPAPPAALLPARLIVPQWMRTGVPPGRAAALPPRLSAAASCAVPPYQPRTDIGAAAEARRAGLYPLIVLAACEHALPVALFDALIGQESRYAPGALSPKGAIGLAQLMPATARELGVDARDQLDNLRGGARYLRRQFDTFGRVELALAAYNAGPGRVQAAGGIPAIAETLAYVGAITRAWRRLEEEAVRAGTSGSGL